MKKTSTNKKSAKKSPDSLKQTTRSDRSHFQMNEEAEENPESYVRFGDKYMGDGVGLGFWGVVGVNGEGEDPEGEKHQKDHREHQERRQNQRVW